MPESTDPIPGQHGGRRSGAGRPVGFSQKDQDPKKADYYSTLAKAKAKREVFKANMAEVEFRLKVGELYDRSELLRVIATSIAIFAEQIRSLPDKLERKAGITTKQAEIAEIEVDNQLDALRNRLANGLADGVNKESLIHALRQLLAGIEYGE